jgi:mannuronan 5-epimerase
VILRNRYVDNYYYGIDPHDRSRRLIIAENRVWGTKVRHGIIGSREVDDSFIFRNVSFNNHLSGIMLDRLSNRNLVAYNVTYGNGSDGIAMYESHNNLLYANQVFENAHHGIRFRNSRDIRMVDNLILKNGRYGVYGHIKDLSYQTYRDFKLDPYEARSSAQLQGGLIGLNKSGAVFVDDTERLQLSNLKLEENGGTTPLRGDLRSQAAEILLALQQSNAQVQLTQTPTALP